MTKIDDFSVEEVLKDYQDNERDIKMFQLMIEGNWNTVSNARLHLSQCIKMRSAIKNKLEELNYDLSSL